jgi:Amidohydrolase
MVPISLSTKGWDVAVDFPSLPIIMAHPSFPWQDEAISICLHKPNVYIDLSGWSPKYFSPTLLQYANSRLRSKVLFGSDYPFITPDRWLADFAQIKPVNSWKELTAGCFSPSVDRCKVCNREQHLISLYAVLKKQTTPGAAFLHVTNLR